MLGIIKTVNGQKKIIPLTADAGAGNPVGTIIPMYKKSNPSGYLYCNGSTFDQTKYPLLYAYLGSNVLPDYREFALVGAEENTTDVYNASTNPNGTIHDHDVYTEGQAKDDQLQDHKHSINAKLGGTNGTTAGTFGGDSAGSSTNSVNNSYRVGTVTRGKRKAVFFYIKATSGLSENAQDNVVAQLNEERSYSTEEINTGKKWIDGKPIYRKVFYSATNWADQALVGNILNIREIVKIDNISSNNTNTGVFDNYGDGGANVSLAYVNPTSGNVFVYRKGTFLNNYPSSITVEYTKTTD